VYIKAAKLTVLEMPSTSPHITFDCNYV